MDFVGPKRKFKKKKMKGKNKLYLNTTKYQLKNKSPTNSLMF